MSPQPGSNASHERPPIHDDGAKPPFSYATLIGMAILSSPDRKLTLAQIYKWINDTFQWYRKSKSGWQNSIRHNLSLNKAFRKQERPKSDPGKGNYWLVEDGCESQFIKGRVLKRSSPTDKSKQPDSPPNSLNPAPDSKSSTDSSKSDEPHKPSSPIKRAKIALGLQHFSKTTFDIESPTKKRGIGAIDVSTESTSFAELPSPSLYKRRRYNSLRSVSDSYAPYFGSSLSSTTSIDENPENSTQNSNSSCSAQNPWIPFSLDSSNSCLTPLYGSVDDFHPDAASDDIHGLLRSNEMEKLGPAITLNRSVAPRSHSKPINPNSAPKLFSPSPFKKTFGPFNPTLGFSPVSHEFEDIYPYSPIRSSPSRSRSALGIGSFNASSSNNSQFPFTPSNAFDDDYKHLFASPDSRGLSIPSSTSVPPASSSDSISGSIDATASQVAKKNLLFGNSSKSNLSGLTVTPKAKKAGSFSSTCSSNNPLHGSSNVENTITLATEFKEKNTRASTVLIPISETALPNTFTASTTTPSLKRRYNPTDVSFQNEDDGDDDTEEEDEKSDSFTKPKSYETTTKKHSFLVPSVGITDPTSSTAFFQSVAQAHTPNKFQCLELRNLDVERFLHYDSPIKTQSSVFSPQSRDRPDYY